MELRRIGTAAFRSSTRDLPFAQLFQSNRQNVIRTPITHRVLSTTSRTYAINPEPTTRAGFTPESSESQPESSSETFNASPASPPTPKEDTLEALGVGSIRQALPWLQSNQSPAPSQFKPSSAQIENRDTSPTTYQSPQLKSAALLDRISNPSATNPSRFRGIESPFSKMEFPKNTGISSASDLMRETATSMLLNQKPRTIMRLSPRTGRTFDIMSSIDLSRGIRMLEASCALNKVRQDQTLQRYHERGGMKRKRLRQQRWRKNFKEGFKGIVGRVKQLKNQGW